MVLLVLSQAPLLYNPLLQFSQCKLHLSVSCRLISQRCPCLALLQLYLRTHTNSIRPENDSACKRRGAACGVFTSGTWILQVRGSCWGHILGVGARQQRRSLVHAVGGHVVDREKWRGGSWLHRVFPQHGGAASGWLLVPTRSGPAAAAPLTEAWWGEELRGGPRPSQFMLVHTEGIFLFFPDKLHWFKKRFPFNTPNTYLFIFKPK